MVCSSRLTIRLDSTMINIWYCNTNWTEDEWKEEMTDTSKVTATVLDKNLIYPFFSLYRYRRIKSIAFWYMILLPIIANSYIIIIQLRSYTSLHTASMQDE